MILSSMSRILREPTDEGGGGGGTGNPNPPAQTGGLSSDQQKIANAVNKVAATQTPATNDVPKPAATARPVRPVGATRPSAALLETEFKVEDDAPEDLRETPTDNGQQQLQQQKKDDGTPQQTQQPQKKADATKTVPQQKATTTTVSVKPGDAKGSDKGFDYNGFTEDEVKLLKQMSNPAREYTAKVIREHRELKNGQPQAFYQHPEGYTLLPEYRKIGEDIDFASRELTFWKQQLINIRQGKDWHMLTGFDAQGNPMVRGPMKPTDEHEIDVNNAVQVMMGTLQQYNQRRDQLKQGYSEQIKKDDAVLQAERAARFAWVNDPKQLDETISIPGVGEVPLKKIGEDFEQLFAPYHRSSPLMGLCKDMFIALQIYGANIRGLQSQLDGGKKLATDAAEMEPSPETVNAEGGKGDLVFDMKDMP